MIDFLCVTELMYRLKQHTGQAPDVGASGAEASLRCHLSPTSAAFWLKFWLCHPENYLFSSYKRAFLTQSI